MKKLILFLSLVLLVGFQIPAYGAQAKASTDTGYLGNDQWIIDSDGDLVPASDSSQDLGASGSELEYIYVDTLVVGGDSVVGASQITSPMTDYDGYTCTTDGGTDIKLFDDGDITLGGATATDVAITFDSDTNDYYVAVCDDENELHIGYGSVVGTTEQISIQSSGVIMIGEDTDVDSGFVFQSGAQDYYMGIDYTGGTEEDLFCIGLGATIGVTPELAIGKATGAVFVNLLDALGAADLDIGSADVTDVTVKTDGGTLILDGTITLTNLDVISNATDDTIRVASEDADTILEVYTPFDTTGDATLKLSADLGNEAGEQWTITSTGATTDLVIGCDDSASGTPITTFTIADDGIVTTINYIDSKITNTATNAVTDVMHLTHDGGTAAAGVGTGLVFQVDDAGGIEEQMSIDVALSTVTDAAEDADLIISLNSAGTMREVLRIDTDEGATTANVLEFNSYTTETDGIVDIVELYLNTGTATNNMGAGITISLEDATGIEEKASIDFQVTDATRTVCDTAIIFRQDTGGTVSETLKLVANSSATTSDYLQFTANTTETDGLTDVLVLKTATGTATNNYGMSISFQPEDATGSEEKASIDIVQTTAARATNDTDIVFSQDGAGDIQETLRLVAADAADASDYLKYTGNTSETNGIVDIMQLRLSSSGTVVDDLGAGISIQLDDATGIEEHASIDFVMTDATRTTCDTDIVFNQDVAGTMTEALRLDADFGLNFNGGLIGGYEDVTTTAGDPQGTGTLSIAEFVSFVVTDATGASADSVTLADGTAGQIKVVVLKTDNETTGLEVTPATYNGGTNVLLEDAGDGVTFLFDGTSWNLVSNNGGTVQ